MQLEQIPQDLRDAVSPSPRGRLVYRCLNCRAEHPIEKLLYTCPDCGSVMLIEDAEFDRLKETPGETWRRLFDHRRMLNNPALKGVFLYHELVAPIIPLEDVIYLGEGQTPMTKANGRLSQLAGCEFYFKNDGLNPSASFKDRGMASAVSYLNYLLNSGRVERLLAVCASTGDTSAAAALYAGYLDDRVSSAVLLPQGKVTPAQLGQPLGAGATVIEIPGVFDDCMKVVEHLAENYPVALLNSKNAWRILGQQTYAFEIAQDFDWDVSNLTVIVPIGNAGNITAVMGGFLKLHELGIIDQLPRIIGVQSAHADPVFRYYSQSDRAKRVWKPVAVQPSAAQAAMIGNPVSMPRVIELARRVEAISGQEPAVVQVTEQEIMEGMLIANRNGHVVCTQGGECLAGLITAVKNGLIEAGTTAVLDSTAHMLKFMDFQNAYFNDSLDPALGVETKAEFKNAPLLVKPDGVPHPAPNKPLTGPDLDAFVVAAARLTARKLGLE